MITNEQGYINSTDRCMVCLAPFTETLENPMEKHHIRYYPEAIAWVHFKCHIKIHDEKKPMNTFIQYDAGEPERFESEKKVLDD